MTFSDHRAEGSAAAHRAFGSVITAMVTPFDHRGEPDDAGAATLATWLTQPGWNDGIVVNGTTGESLATSDREKASMVQWVAQAVRDRGTKIIAGVGAGDTRHSVALAIAAASQGADALLVVAPYYSRPSQRGILEHFLAIADSTPLPVMLYDIPKRTGVAVEPDTFVAAAKHPRILAVKDAKGDLESSAWVMERTNLAYYSGDDALNLPLLSIGAVGFVSVVGHVVGNRLRDLLESYTEGRVVEAREIHRGLLPGLPGNVPRSRHRVRQGRTVLPGPSRRARQAATGRPHERRDQRADAGPCVVAGSIHPAGMNGIDTIVCKGRP